MSDGVQEHDQHVRTRNIAGVFKEVEGWTKEEIRDPARVEAAITALRVNGHPRPVTALEVILQMG